MLTGRKIATASGFTVLAIIISSVCLFCPFTARPVQAMTVSVHSRIAGCEGNGSLVHTTENSARISARHLNSDNCPMLHAGRDLQSSDLSDYRLSFGHSIHRPADDATFGRMPPMAFARSKINSRRNHLPRPPNRDLAGMIVKNE
jgi:hypothetical protein